MSKKKYRRTKKGERLFEKWMPARSDIRKIFELFFQPLFRHVTVPNSGTKVERELSHKFDILLGRKDREIPIFKAKAAFSLPGYKVERGGARVVENALVRSERKVEEGATLLLRFDERAPEYIDLQYWNTRWDKAGDERVFRLNQAEWNYIRENLEEVSE